MRRVILEPLDTGAAALVLQEDGDELWMLNSRCDLARIVDAVNELLRHADKPRQRARRWLRWRRL